MADNVGYTPGSGATIAADDIGGALYQRVKMIHGADGIAHETADGNPLPVYLRDSAATTSFGPITSSNTVLFSAVEMSNEKSVSLQLGGLWDGAIYLQQSNDDVTWFDVQGISQNNSGGLTSTIYAPDLVTIHTVARYFRAITSLDFTGTVSGSYAARAIQPPILQQDVRLAEIADDVRVHMFARDRNGYSMGLRTNPFGGLLVADNEPVTGNLNRLGPVVQLETTGYNSVSVQVVSNDGSTWNSVLAWPVAGGTAPVSTTTASGQWLVPAIGRFFRAQVTTYTSGMAVVVAVLKNQNAWQPQSTPSVTIASNSAVNVSQIGGTTPVTAGVAGMLAVGGNIAEDTAATSNPLICGGVARTSLPASTVIAGDAIRQTFSVSGQLVTKLNAPADLDFYVNATVTTNTQTALRAAQASPIRQNVTSLTFQNTNATATTLTIQDGSTTLITFSVPASMTLPVQLDFPTPLRGTAATALNYTAGTTGANVLLNVTGFNSY
jgi:hypothetical protein